MSPRPAHGGESEHGRQQHSEAGRAETDELGIDTDRIAGADRYETAARIARRAITRSDCYPVTDVAVASGIDPFGGLAAGAVRGPCQPLLLAVASGVSVPTGSTGSDAAAGSQDWSGIAEAVVEVECLDTSGRVLKSGSGFFVDDGRHVVTNYHVVEHPRSGACRRIRIALDGTFEQMPTRELPVSLKRSAPIRDLALLETDPDLVPNRTLSISTEALRAGESLTALGYPTLGGSTLTLTTGRYSGVQQHNDLKWIKTDTRIAPGNSGGPVLNDRQEVIGVATLLRIAIRGQVGITVGTLSLLVPAEDVIALIAGDLGE